MTTKSHENHAESAEGWNTGSEKERSPTRELSENEKGRVQQTPEERKSDRDLGAPFFFLFFSCNAGLVLDMVGQLLEIVKTALKISLVSKHKQKTTPTQPNNTKHPKQTPTQKPRDGQQNNQGDL